MSSVFRRRAKIKPNLPGSRPPAGSATPAKTVKTEGGGGGVSGGVGGAQTPGGSSELKTEVGRGSSANSDIGSAHSSGSDGKRDYSSKGVSAPVRHSPCNITGDSVEGSKAAIVNKLVGLSETIRPLSPISSASAASPSLFLTSPQSQSQTISASSFPLPSASSFTSPLEPSSSVRSVNGGVDEIKSEPRKLVLSSTSKLSRPGSRHRIPLPFLSGNGVGGGGGAAAAVKINLSQTQKPAVSADRSLTSNTSLASLKQSPSASAENTVSCSAPTSIAKPAATSIAKLEPTSIAKPAAISFVKSAATSIARPAPTSIAKPAATSIAKPEPTSIAKPAATSISKSAATSSISTPVPLKNQSAINSESANAVSATSSTSHFVSPSATRIRGPSSSSIQSSAAKPRESSPNTVVESASARQESSPSPSLVKDAHSPFLRLRLPSSAESLSQDDNKKASRKDGTDSGPSDAVVSPQKKTPSRCLEASDSSSLEVKTASRDLPSKESIACRTAETSGSGGREQDSKFSVKSGSRETASPQSAPPASGPLGIALSPEAVQQQPAPQQPAPQQHAPQQPAPHQPAPSSSVPKPEVKKPALLRRPTLKPKPKIGAPKGAAASVPIVKREVITTPEVKQSTSFSAAVENTPTPKEGTTAKANASVAPASKTLPSSIKNVAYASSTASYAKTAQSSKAVPSAKIEAINPHEIMSLESLASHDDLSDDVSSWGSQRNFILIMAHFNNGSFE